MISGIPQPERSSIADKMVVDLNNATLGANLHAFTNDFVPSPLAVVGDFVEANFDGYVKKTALTTFAKLHDAATGDYRVYLPTQQVFTAGTLTAALTVAGVYLTKSDDVTLQGWQVFDTPQPLNALGDSILVDVELRVPLDTCQVTA